jgi:hypothetical protein
MLEEYKSGRTPNPDINCNRFIKFGSFYDYAFNDLGADFLATGHYARLLYPSSPSHLEKALAAASPEEQSKRWMEMTYDPSNAAHPIDRVSLVTSVDNFKDQTYFLSGVAPSQLTRCIFPLGHLRKSQVRAIAQQLNVPVKEKRDSTGVCFVGKKRKFSDFLAQYIPANFNEPGPAISFATALELIMPLALRTEKRRKEEIYRTGDTVPLLYMTPALHSPLVHVEAVCSADVLSSRELSVPGHNEGAVGDLTGFTEAPKHVYVRGTYSLFQPIPEAVDVDDKLRYTFDPARNRYYIATNGHFLFDSATRMVQFKPLRATPGADKPAHSGAKLDKKSKPVHSASAAQPDAHRGLAKQRSPDEIAELISKTHQVKTKPSLVGGSPIPIISRRRPATDPVDEEEPEVMARAPADWSVPAALEPAQAALLPMAADYADDPEEAVRAFLHGGARERLLEVPGLRGDWWSLYYWTHPDVAAERGLRVVRLGSVVVHYGDAMSAEAHEWVMRAIYPAQYSLRTGYRIDDDAYEEMSRRMHATQSPAALVLMAERTQEKLERFRALTRTWASAAVHDDADFENIAVTFIHSFPHLFDVPNNKPKGSTYSQCPVTGKPLVGGVNKRRTTAFRAVRRAVTQKVYSFHGSAAEHLENIRKTRQALADMHKTLARDVGKVVETLKSDQYKSRGRDEVVPFVPGVHPQNRPLAANLHVRRDEFPLHWRHQGLLGVTENQSVVVDPAHSTSARVLRKLRDINTIVTIPDDHPAAARHSILLRGVNWISPRQPYFSGTRVFDPNELRSIEHTRAVSEYIADDHARFARDLKTYHDARAAREAFEQAKEQGDVLPAPPARIPPPPLPAHTGFAYHMLLNALFPFSDRAINREGQFRGFIKLASTGQLVRCKLYPELVPKVLLQEDTPPATSPEQVAMDVMAPTTRNGEEMELCYRVEFDSPLAFLAAGQTGTLYRHVREPFDESAATVAFSEFDLEEDRSSTNISKSNHVRGSTKSLENSLFECLGSGTIVL